MRLFFMRAFVWILVHVMYRVQALGVVKAVPRSGACVVVCNHVSFVDALIITALTKRPIRFVMDHRIFKKPVLGWLFRTARAIPIAPGKENPILKEKAFEDVKLALAQGHVVGIFPEGQITRDGNLNVFKPGIERIIEETPVPVVPLALRGLWGSFFSRVEGHAMTKLFRRGVWSRVELVAGDVVPANLVTARVLEDHVRELRGDVR